MVVLFPMDVLTVIPVVFALLVAVVLFTLVDAPMRVRELFIVGVVLLTLVDAVIPVVELFIVGVVLSTLVDAVIPVVELFMFDHVLEPALSVAKPGGLPPLLLKSSFIVVCVCVCPGSLIEVLAV